LKVIITGATGYIGRVLSENLIESGNQVIALSRNKDRSESVLGNKVTCIEWDGTTSSGWANYAEDADVIINLAGANLSSKIWTSSYKKEIWDSRVNSGRAIVQAVVRAKHKPRLVVQASAVGYYGSKGDEILDEKSLKGSGFLSDVVQAWENSTKDVEAHGARRLIIRSGIVLGKGSKILSLLKIPFKLFVGGYAGSGKQWISWIHLEDEIRIIRFLIDNPQISGKVNLVSPEPVKMKEFAQGIGKIIKRPSWTKAPAFLMRLFLGDMAKETVLASQKIFPKKLLEAGYQFKFPNLEPALAESFNEK
jgi:uncharacterized protein (TIGR01777 family)